MAGMKLMGNTASPYVRKVMVTAIETDQDDEIEMIESLGSPTDPDVARNSVNPLGKVPSLVRPEGPALFDSRVICRYLDARSGGGLYPAGQLWEVLTLEALGDGILDAAVLMVYERRCRPEDMVSDDWLAAQAGKIDRALDALDARWTSHLAGKLTAAQIAVGCALGYLDFRLSERNWRQGRTALAAWETRFAERPSMVRTKPH